MRAHPDIIHHKWGPKKEGLGQVRDAEMFHLANSGHELEGASGERHPVSTAWLATLRTISNSLI